MGGSWIILSVGLVHVSQLLVLLVEEDRAGCTEKAGTEKMKKFSMNEAVLISE